MINGKEYGWEDITAYMGGRDVMGFRSIKYTTKKEKEALYGKGNKAKSRRWRLHRAARCSTFSST